MAIFQENIRSFDQSNASFYEDVIPNDFDFLKIRKKAYVFSQIIGKKTNKPLNRENR